MLTEMQVETMAKMFCEMTKDYEDAVLKETVKGVMGLAMKKVQRGVTLDDFRSLVQGREKNCQAVRKVCPQHPLKSSAPCELQQSGAGLSEVGVGFAAGK